ncbi:MAG TPA: HEAT repeat domain-containing protein [Geminicoccaceae bacterium]|nr:HEAT repeat domain-containing protein [Geminicoccaceae bacterium]
MSGRLAWCRSGGVGAALILALGWTLPAAAQEAATAPAAGPVTVRWADGRLAAEVGAVPVQTVLQAIAEATGAEVRGSGELGTTSAQSFEGLPIEAALRRLVGDHGILVRYAPPAPGESGSRVAAIRVYAVEPGARERAAAAAQARSAQAGAAPAPRDTAAAAAAASTAAAEQASLIQELVDRGDDEAAAELQRALAGATDARLRRQLVGALVSVGTPRSAEGLALALRDPEPDIRRQAARGLWEVEGAAAADRLEAALAVEQDRAVRRLLEQLLERARPGSAPPG